MLTEGLHGRLVEAGKACLRALGYSRVEDAVTIMLYSGSRVHPDIYAAAPGVCAVAEAKATREDFLRSVQHYRERTARPGWSPLAQRHYLVVPDRRIARDAPRGWGVIEWREVVVPAEPVECRMKRSDN